MSRDGSFPDESARGTEARTTSAKVERQFALIVLAAFLLVTAPVVLRHEMWRDEIQAWLLARDTVSLGQLFHLLHYEGHPSLWYLLLRPVAQALRDPRWIQPLALALSCCSVYLFARFAPFSRLVRVLFAFGYFVVYGWTVVARSYGLGLTLSVLLCVLLTRPRQRSGYVALVMALLANTSVYGSMIVAACCVALVVNAVFVRPRSGCAARLRSVALPVVAGLAAVLLAAIQVWPAPDNAFVGPGLPGVRHTDDYSAVERPFVALTPIWRGYVPIPRVEEVSDIWWANFLVDRSKNGAVLAGMLTIVGVVVLAMLLRRSVLGLTFYLASTAILELFSMLVYGGSLYHHGYFFLAVMMALWFAASQTAGNPAVVNARASRVWARWLDARAQLVIVTLLVLQVIGGGFRVVTDLAMPFSEGEAAADYIRSHELERFPMLFAAGFYGTTVSAYLDRPVFALDRNVRMTYVPLNRPAAVLDDASVLARVDSCCAARDSVMILMLPHALEATSSSLNIRPLAALGHAMAPERFYLYEVRPRR